MTIVESEWKNEILKSQVVTILKLKFYRVNRTNKMFWKNSICEHFKSFLCLSIISDSLEPFGLSNDISVVSSFPSSIKNCLSLETNEPFGIFVSECGQHHLQGGDARVGKATRPSRKALGLCERRSLEWVSSFPNLKISNKTNWWYLTLQYYRKKYILRVKKHFVCNWIEL